MKRIIVTALLSLAFLMPTQFTSAQTRVQGHFQTISFPGQRMAVCNVNGAYYPVDYNYQIWSVDSFGNWVMVIGHLVIAPNGTFAVRNDGVTFPAFCQ
jgi:hypothetical protein